MKETEKRETLTDYDPDLYYANQMINDACGTYALLSILMNRYKDIELGEELSNLRGFSLQMNSKDKGWAIGNSDKVRVAHNSFAAEKVFEIEEAKSGKEQDAFHFISYMPVNG